MTGALLLGLFLFQTTDCGAFGGARSLGLATAGSTGLVRLELEGAPVLGHPFALRVASARPGALGFLVTAPAIEPTPLSAFGAIFFPARPWTLEPFRVEPNGSSPPIEVVARVVPDLLGRSFVAQGVVVDATAQGGAAFTRAAWFCYGEQAPGPAFPVPSLDAGDLPEVVRSRDLDGDGRMDIVATTRGVGTAVHPAGEVLAFLQNENGHFAPSIVSVIGPADPLFLELGDLDGDRALDAIATSTAASPLEHTVTSLKGDGAGSFTLVQTLAVPGVTNGAALGDLDRDEALDLVATFERPSGVLVFRGRGDGTFDPPVALPIGFTPYGQLELADLDLDGDLDLVVETDAPAVALGNGDGTFGPFVQWSAPSITVMNGFDLAELDGDGRPDLVVGSLARNSYTILYGAPGGTFPTSVSGVFQGSSFRYPHDVLVADVTGDGRPDLVVPTNVELLVLPGDDRGLFGSERRYPTDLANVTELADMDGDGLCDVLQGTFSRRVVLLRSLGEGELEVPDQRTVGSENRAPVIADVTGDQSPDVVVAALLDDEIVILPGGEGTALGPPLTLATPAGPFDVVAHDLDADGVVDLAVACLFADQVAVYRGTGGGSFAPLPPFGGVTEPSDLAAGDVDEDGVVDLVAANRGASDASVFLGVGDGTFGPATRFAAGAAPNALVLADLDGDGHPDLAVSSSADGVLHVLPGAGTGAFPVKTLVGTTVAQPLGLAAGDLDVDGIPDLVVVGQEDGLVVHRGLGGGAFDAAEAVPGSRGGNGLVLGDLDGDLLLDVAVANGRGFEVTVFPGLGDGTFGQDASYHTLRTPTGIVAGDLDGDLEPDLVVASFSDSVVVLANRLLRVRRQTPSSSFPGPGGRRPAGP